MKKLIRALLVAVAFLCFHTSQSQSTYSELSDKYWQYRDRFKKHFIKIGLGPGESIPASTWRVNWGHSGDHDNSALYWTDATIYLGHYLQVLATEYKLLQQNNLSTSATLNELYYALRALGRLDASAEPFLYGESAQINGLLLRDDVPSNFHEQFNNSESAIFNTTSPLGYTHSDYAPLTIYSSQGNVGSNQTQNINNVQSLDQLVDIFSGIYLIYKLIPNVPIQPPGEESIMLHPYITNIIGRIYARLENHGYVIRHYNSDEAVSRGPVCWYAAPIFKSISREMLGGFEGYSEFLEGMYQISPEYAEELAADHGVPVLYPAENPVLPHNALSGQWNFLENNNVPLSNNGFCFGDGEFIEALTNLSENLINLLLDVWPGSNSEVEFSECLAGGIMNEDNLHITFQLGLLTNMWSPEYVYSNSMLSENGFYWYPLLYEVLHGYGGDLNDGNESFYLNLLSSAPCEGPWSDPNYAYFGESGAQAPNGWASQNRLFHPDNAITGPEERSFRGEYSGLDYMLYHNLTQLVFGTEQTFGLEKTCACAEQLVDSDYINYDVSSSPAFDSYIQMEIKIPDYLSHPTTFDNSELHLHNDLIICKPTASQSTEVEFINGAELKIDVGVKVTVKSGCTLTIDASSLTFSDNEFNDGLSSTIIVEDGATLNIINGSIVNVRTDHASNIYVLGECNVNHSAFDLEHEAAQLLLTSESNGLANIFDTDYSQSYLGKIHFQSNYNGKILCDNLDWTTQGSTLTGRHNGEIILMNSTLTCNDCEIDLNHQAKLRVEQSALNMTSGALRFESGAEFHTIETQLHFLDNTQLIFNDAENNSSLWEYALSTLQLEGNNSKVELSGGVLHIGQGSVFKPTFETIGGFIEIGGQIDHAIVMEPGSQLWLEGDGTSDLILKVINHAHLWIDQSLANVTLRNGFVNLGGHGHVWTASSLSAYNTLFSDEYTDNSTADIQVSFKNASFNLCKLNGVGYKGVQNNSTFLNSEIIRGEGITQNGGRYLISSCVFSSADVQSHLLTNVSRVVNSTFINPFNFSLSAIKDLGQSELIVETTSIDGFVNGVQKRFGKFSSRCNSITNCNNAIKVENGMLNLSGLSNAGFNSFESNLNNAVLSNAVGLDIEKGYNYFGAPGSKNISGTIAATCGKLCQPITISANGNQWWSNPSDLVELTTNNANNCGSICEIYLQDNNPVVWDGCPSAKPFPKPRSASSITTVEAHANSRSLDELYLSDYGFLALDSALGIAASRMETYDSLANDVSALHLFHEILTSGLELDSADVRAAAQWGVEHMKTTLENLFVSNEVSPAQNRNEFHPFVQEYVDVLNALTTESTSDSLVTSQFYLELNKGHLFRTIKKPEMAKEIFTHLDDCSLDSLEQSIVNYWLLEIENEIDMLANFDEWGDPSLIVVSDSLALNDIDFSAQDDYRFGVYIHDPNYVSFVNCSQIVFNRGVENGQSYLFAYPNPSKGDFFVQNEMEGPLNLQVFDALGTLVLQHTETSGGLLHIPLPSALSPGRYVVKLISPKETATLSLIKE